MSGESRFLVVSPGQLGASIDTLEDAVTQASRATDKDRTTRLIVQVVAEVKPRQEPNVDVRRFDTEAANG